MNTDKSVWTLLKQLFGRVFRKVTRQVLSDEERLVAHKYEVNKMCYTIGMVLQTNARLSQDAVAINMGGKARCNMHLINIDPANLLDLANHLVEDGY